MSSGEANNFLEHRAMPMQASVDTDLSLFAWNEMRCAQHAPRLPQDVARLEHDRDGHITSMTTADGVNYQYSQFDCEGQPTVCKIIDGKTGDWGQWRQESEGIWRSYHRDKPNYEILRGRWVVDEYGKMHMEGEQDTAPLPSDRHRQHKIGPGPNGLPGSPPDGYRFLHGAVPPQAVREAQSLLAGDYGTETPFEINGKMYMARVEPHYHPPGYKFGPTGWHKGVTVYEAIDR
jgi:hypothetical protein